MNIRRECLIFIKASCILKEKQTVPLISSGYFFCCKSVILNNFVSKKPWGNICLYMKTARCIEDVLITTVDEKMMKLPLQVLMIIYIIHILISHAFFTGSLGHYSLKCAELWHSAYQICSEGDVLEQEIIDQNLQPVLGDQAVGLGRTSPAHSDWHRILGCSF